MTHALGSGLGGDVDCGCEGVGEFVISCMDASPVLEAAEHSFDQVALAIALSVERVRILAGWIVGYDRQGSSFGEELSQSLAVIGGVGGADGGRRQRREQRSGDTDVSELPGRNLEGYRSTIAIDDGMDLRCPTAARAPNRLNLRPPFPPAAQR